MAVDVGPLPGKGLIYQLGPLKIGLEVVTDEVIGTDMIISGLFDAAGNFQQGDNLYAPGDAGSWQQAYDTHGGGGDFWAWVLPTINAHLASLYVLDVYSLTVSNGDAYTRPKANAIMYQYLEGYTVTNPDGSSYMQIRQKT